MNDHDRIRVSATGSEALDAPALGEGYYYFSGPLKIRDDTPDAAGVIVDFMETVAREVERHLHVEPVGSEQEAIYAIILNLETYIDAHGIHIESARRLLALARRVELSLP